MSPLTKSPCPPELALDEAGRLYDPRVRAKLQGWLEADLVESVEAAFAFRWAAHRMHLWMERWAEERGMSEGRVHVLLALGRAPDRRLALGRLASDLGVVPRTVTGLVDHLERDGLVAREQDPEDRRSFYARLTPSGAERTELLKQQALERQVAFARELTGDQLAELRHLCLKVGVSLESAPARPEAGQ